MYAIMVEELLVNNNRRYATAVCLAALPSVGSGAVNNFLLTRLRFLPSLQHPPGETPLQSLPTTVHNTL